MKSIVTSIAASSFFAALAIAQQPQYSVTDLGTFGGSFGVAYSVSNEGRVAGAANMPDGTQRGFLSGIGSTKYDLGTLGGPNSNMGGLNASNVMALFAETSKKDPLGQDFCGYGTNLICLPAIWNGALTPLPTLGGNNGIAFAINDAGQATGVTENSTKDSTCSQAHQALDFEAVLWGPNPGQVQSLPPLPGDTVGFALALNSSGQVAGASGTCANTVVVPFALAPHAVLWDHGTPISLGNLGGAMVAVAAGINDAGQVDGAADLPSEIPGFPGVQVHGFVWTQSTGMQDIGTVGSDFSSLPEQINNKGQMVGASCDDMGNCRAFLWQNKVMVDLNSLIPANSPLYLMWAFAINEEGVIAGMAVDAGTGDVHAFRATPNPTATADSLLPAVQSETRLMSLSENARRLLRRRVGMIGW
ncbi:MAG TPA: hypothetical protein VMH81_21195 [Bryobacteraceae bacterium]|nr:hypothetical protein [Bryobacteraceae bacterium]